MSTSSIASRPSAIGRPSSTSTMLSLDSAIDAQLAKWAGEFTGEVLMLSSRRRAQPAL